MATFSDVLSAAILRSDMNDAELLPLAWSLKVVSQFERAVFLRAARLNPNYFGVEGNSNARTAYTQDWDLTVAPGFVAAVSQARVQTIVGSVTGVAVGDVINLVDWRRPGVSVAPRAYIRNRRIIGHGTELGAADGNMVTQLKLYYSRLPPPLINAQQTLLLPDEWMDLVSVPLARYLCMRDSMTGRLEEVPHLDAEIKTLWALFEEAVMSFDHGVVRALDSVPAIPVLNG